MMMEIFNVKGVQNNVSLVMIIIDVKLVRRILLYLWINATDVTFRDVPFVLQITHVLVAMTDIFFQKKHAKNVQKIVNNVIKMEFVNNARIIMLCYLLVIVF